MAGQQACTALRYCTGQAWLHAFSIAAESVLPLSQPLHCLQRHSPPCTTLNALCADHRFDSANSILRCSWSRWTPFFDCPPKICKVDLHELRHRVGEHGAEEAEQEPALVPSDGTLTKLFYLALRNISQKWTIQFGDRIAVN